MLILAHDGVDDGYGHKGVDQGEQHREGVAAGGKVQRDRYGRVETSRQRKKPQVALAVDVANRVPVCRLCHEFHDEPRSIPPPGSMSAINSPRLSCACGLWPVYLPDVQPRTLTAWNSRLFRRARTTAIPTDPHP